MYYSWGLASKAAARDPSYPGLRVPSAQGGPSSPEHLCPLGKRRRWLWSHQEASGGHGRALYTGLQVLYTGLQVLSCKQGPGRDGQTGPQEGSKGAGAAPVLILGTAPDDHSSWDREGRPRAAETEAGLRTVDSWGLALS